MYTKQKDRSEKFKKLEKSLFHKQEYFFRSMVHIFQVYQIGSNPGTGL